MNGGARGGKTCPNNSGRRKDEEEVRRKKKKLKKATISKVVRIHNPSGQSETEEGGSSGNPEEKGEKDLRSGPQGRKGQPK